jgi:PAS domain S-box-containing protein
VNSYQKYSAGFFFFFFSFSACPAHIIDSLKSVIKKNAPDTNRVNNLAHLAFELHSANKYDESLLCINQGIVLAEKLNYSNGQAELHRAKGDYFRFKNSYSKSLQEYTKALGIDTREGRKIKMVASLDKLAKLFLEMGDFTKAVSGFEKELALSKELHDTIQVAQLQLDLWQVHYENTKDFSKAANCILAIKEMINSASGDSVLSSLYSKLNAFYFANRDYERAAEYMNKSLVLHKKKNDFKRLAVDYYELGGLYERVGNYHKALEYYQEILKIYITFGDKDKLGIAYNNVGWGYQLIGDYRKALEYQLSSYAYYMEAANYTATKFPMGNLGVIYNKLGDYLKAIDYSNKAMALFEQDNDINGVSEATNNIGLAYANMGDYKKAITFLKKGLDLAKSIQENYEMKNSYSGLALCYQKTNDYSKAFQYYQLYSQLRDSMVSQQYSDRISGMNFSIENEKNQKAIELLSKDVLVNELSLKRQRTLTYTAIAGTLLTFFLFFFVLKGYRQKKKSNELLERSNSELEKSYQSTKLLSEIGREITCCLSIEDIIQSVYKNILPWMDASSFWIGIYNQSKQSLDYTSGKENGKTFPFFSYSLTEDGSLAVWAFKNQKEVFINDYAKEYHNYIPQGTAPAARIGETPQSSIWYPLVSKDSNTIGILTIQSFKKNAYTNYHLNIVRSLAVFTSIALENALLYHKIEQVVIERTVEVVKQKEEIERSYSNIKLISDIGREITASLQVEEIIEKVYQRVNTLMDAPVFLIGIHDVKNNRIAVLGAIENGKRQPFYYYNLEEPDRPAVLCFNKQQELVMNDLALDFDKYFPGIKPPSPLIGTKPESLIYLPLTTANKKLGVISFQSFKKNAYTEYQQNIIRTLAIYVSIALENANLYGNMETEVKERTAEIEKQKEELAKLSIVASETDNAIIIADANATIEWVNESYTRLTGYSIEDLKAENKTSICAVSDNPDIKEIIDDCLKTSKPVVYKVLNHTKDDRKIWVQTSITPVIGKDGKLINLVVIDTDITELKRVETEIKLQHSIISEKNKHITDSINYAKRIQDAILPSLQTLKRLFSNTFVLYKPKDIVSGDFYWMAEKGGKLFFAVVDCTGHGVPGAFVSIIGYNGLNRAVNEFGLIQPSKILDKLNELVEETFGHGHESQINDGMDIALCSYDRQTNVLEFSGAYNPLYIVSDGLLTEIKGDKQPIGAFEHRKVFTNNSIVLKKDDLIYIFSDGYADQFGGPLKKKYKYNQFNQLLTSFQGTPLEQQKEILNTTITQWMGNLDQVDDICIIGMKV